MTNPTSPQFHKTSAEKAKLFHDIVVDVAQKASDLIHECLNSTDLSGKQKWSIHGRIVSVLFNSHFGLSYETAKKADAQTQSEQTEK